MSYSPFADEFIAMMPLVVTLQPFTVTGNGQRVMGTAHQYHAYIASDSKPIYSATGTVAFSTAGIWLHPQALDGTVLTSATANAVLTLPDGGTPRIVAIGAFYDELGIVGWEVRT